MSAPVHRVPRRHEAPFPSVRPVAGLPRLGVPTQSLSIVCRRAGDAAVAAPERVVRDRASATSSVHALGLSAWKQFGASRWALRVNPSSGNLHPTEAYIVAGATPASPTSRRLSLRARSPRAGARAAHSTTVARGIDGSDAWLIALTSIHWREAWKYGERAFRYCQHDMGHAIAAMRLRGGDGRLPRDAAAGVVARRHRRADRHRSRRGLRRGRAGRAGLPDRCQPPDRRSSARRRAVASQSRSARRAAAASRPSGPGRGPDARVS